METFQTLIQKCLSQDPKDRPSFEEILKILDTVDDSDDWFIQKHSSSMMCKLAEKGISNNSFNTCLVENHKLFKTYELRGVLETVLSTLPDVSSSYFAACTIIALSHLEEVKNLF